AFGDAKVSGTISNPFTYTGQPSDPATGLLFFPLRVYDPSLGRFLDEDPRPTTAPYSYAANDPTSGTDPSGAELVAYEEAQSPQARAEPAEQCFANQVKAQGVQALFAILKTIGKRGVAYGDAQAFVELAQELGLEHGQCRGPEIHTISR